MHKTFPGFVRAVAVVSALSLGLASPGAVHAQEEAGSSLSSEGGAAALFREIAQASSNNTGSNAAAVGSTLSSLSLIGSSRLKAFGPLLEPLTTPKPLSDGITEPALIDRSVTSDPRWERWTVASPSMRRNVSVQVYRAADTTVPAPMLYLLDGVNAPYDSGWSQPGRLQPVFGDENVTIVIPTEARASLYSDWALYDDNLGLHKWETFITEELAPIMEQQADLNFNGKRGIGGISMGANGAIHLAASRPDLFDATFGISGCYSTLSQVGQQTVSLTVTTRGGDLANLWGPFGSEAWVAHDTPSHAENLAGTAVYLSAGNGIISDEERAFYDTSDDAVSIAVGSIMETAVLPCTQELVDAMDNAGLTHYKVDYTDQGGHNWVNFVTRLQPAWDHIKPALF